MSSDLKTSHANDVSGRTQAILKHFGSREEFKKQLASNDIAKVTLVITSILKLTQNSSDPIVTAINTDLAALQTIITSQGQKYSPVDIDSRKKINSIYDKLFGTPQIPSSASYEFTFNVDQSWAKENRSTYLQLKNFLKSINQTGQADIFKQELLSKNLHGKRELIIDVILWQWCAKSNDLSTLPEIFNSCLDEIELVKEFAVKQRDSSNPFVNLFQRDEALNTDDVSVQNHLEPIRKLASLAEANIASLSQAIIDALMKDIGKKEVAADTVKVSELDQKHSSAAEFTFESAIRPKPVSVNLRSAESLLAARQLGLNVTKINNVNVGPSSNGDLYNQVLNALKYRQVSVAIALADQLPKGQLRDLANLEIQKSQKDQKQADAFYTSVSSTDRISQNACSSYRVPYETPEFVFNIKEGWLNENRLTASLLKNHLVLLQAGYKAGLQALPLTDVSEQEISAIRRYIIGIVIDQWSKQTDLSNLPEIFEPCVEIINKTLSENPDVLTNPNKRQEKEGLFLRIRDSASFVSAARRHDASAASTSGGVAVTYKDEEATILKFINEKIRAALVGIIFSTDTAKKSNEQDQKTALSTSAKSSSTATAATGT